MYMLYIRVGTYIPTCVYIDMARVYVYTRRYTPFFSAFTTGAKRGYPTLLLLLRGRAPHGEAASVQATAIECRRLRYMCAVATDLDYAAVAAAGDRRRRPRMYIILYIYLNVRSSGAQIASETCHFPYTGAYIPVAVSPRRRQPFILLCVYRQTRALDNMDTGKKKTKFVPIYYVGMLGGTLLNIGYVNIFLHENISRHSSFFRVTFPARARGRRRRRRSLSPFENSSESPSPIHLLTRARCSVYTYISSTLSPSIVYHDTTIFRAFRTVSTRIRRTRTAESYDNRTTIA